MSASSNPSSLHRDQASDCGSICGAWEGFRKGRWTEFIDVRDFIQSNVSPYGGGANFLVGATERTRQVSDQVGELLREERARGGLLDTDTSVPSSITSHGPGYIDRQREKIVGLQTDKPLKRAIMPLGGIRMVESSLQAYGHELDPVTRKIFTEYRKTHNAGVFDAYSKDIRLARSSGIVTGLPDAYGRGRIIGDYRRVALYGVDRLIQARKKDLRESDDEAMNEETIRRREEMSEQIRALAELKQMASAYGFDISLPATNATQAIQWTYFAYLAAVKEQNGVAMSIGRVSTFLDIYIQRDIDSGVLTETDAQELVDDLVIKLRLVRFLRPPEYNELFSGDPTWVTESIGGMGTDGRTLVTRSSFRFLQTLVNLGPGPEPNLTVLWSERLPEAFKSFAAHVSMETSSIQYENDDLMQPLYGDDYAIACCVSAMKVGKQMQFFGARANLAKGLLYAINGKIGRLDRLRPRADHRRHSRLRGSDGAFRQAHGLVGPGLCQGPQYHPLHA